MSFKVVFSPKSYKKIKFFIETDHSEISGQLDKIEETLSKPDIIVRSRTDPDIELFYRHYNITPVTEKYLCVIVKILVGDIFIYNCIFHRYDKER